MLLYIDAAGRLIQTDGITAKTLATNRSVGSTPRMSIEEAGNLIALLGSRHLVIVRPGGGLFASARIPPGSRMSSLGVSVSPDGRSVAYTLAPQQPSSLRGREQVVLLRRGAQAPHVMATRRVNLAICERAVGLTWHGRWVLYASGQELMIDTTGEHPPINLTATLHRLPDGPGQVNWASA
jgi:hypothetical protein